ncbi:hypothetical protein BGZ60DRAFT_483840 [Tricladium varicosporioides]|nr:hypothetical protein BGZ60DRAFT_483840 [Hymenoscyphus varicosporioides]
MSTTVSPSCCAECKLTFSGKKALRKHKRAAHLPSLHCTECILVFTGKKALRKHKQAAHPPSFHCTECTLAFTGKKALRKHRLKVHLLQFQCTECDLVFSEKELRLEHIREVHPRCKYCKKRFLGLEELRSHQQQTSHLYCSGCNIYFPDNGEHIAHVRNVQHTTQYHCCDCDREHTSQESLNNHCCKCDKVFKSQKRLKQHFTSLTHIRNATALEPQLDSNLSHRCETCNMGFPSQKMRRKHISSKHKPARHISCPVGGTCSKKFATPSALLNHLESGCCSSGMTRAKMTELVFAHDPNRYITSIDATCTPAQESTSQVRNPATPIAALPHSLLTNKLIPLSLLGNTTGEWSLIHIASSPTTSESTNDWSLIHGVPLTPNISDDTSEWSFTSEKPVTIPSNISTSDINRATSVSRVVSSNDLRCHLCPHDRKPFGSARAFQAHTASAAHAPKIFHCPLSFMPNLKPEDLLKRKSFSTLGGLTQHLESGKCNGGVEMYKKAIKFVEEQLGYLGFSGIQLLSF